MKTLSIILLSLALTAPVAAQTMYKCPSKTPGAPPIYQQMPCTPTGGGEKTTIKPIKTTGTDARINEQGQSYMQENNERWTAQKEARAEESKRQEALDVERAKAVAAKEQADAQRETAAAIRASRWRY